MVGIGVVLLALISYGRFAFSQQLQRADRDRRTPIVIAQPVTNCALSPGGGHLWVVNIRESSVGALFDTASGALVPVTLPTRSLPTNAVWLYDETLLLYTQATVVRPVASPEYLVPQDGWLIDAARGTVTVLADRAPAARAVTQAQAAERNRTMGERNTTPIRSPDGQYLAYSTSIRDNAGQLLNEETGRAGTAPCQDGWRRDSTDLYFIDLSPSGFRGGPGPVRLLLVHPPPPPKHWWQR